MCGMAVAVLRLYGEVDCLIYVFDRNDRQDGHHKLLLYKRVIEIGFADNATDIFPRLYTYHIKQHGGVTPDAFAVDALFGFARLFVGNVHQNYIGKPCGLCVINQIGAVFLHLGYQLIFNAGKSKNLFFRNTGQVVVKCAAVDNILARLNNIGSIINNDGRVAAPAPVPFAEIKPP